MTREVSERMSVAYASEITGHLGPQLFTAMFVYAPDDPLALQVYFPEIMGGHIWLFGRDLVIQALESETAQGEGDISIETLSDSEISFTFTNGSHTSTVHFSRPEVATFVGATAEMVAPGEEDIESALDEFLASL